LFGYTLQHTEVGQADQTRRRRNAAAGPGCRVGSAVIVRGALFEQREGWPAKSTDP